MSRLIRVESLLKEEISKIIHKDFRSNLGLISITTVRVSKDLANATVYYSHFGDKSEQKNRLKSLENPRILSKSNWVEPFDLNAFHI